VGGSSYYGLTIKIREEQVSRGWGGGGGRPVRGGGGGGGFVNHSGPTFAPLQLTDSYEGEENDIRGGKR